MWSSLRGGGEGRGHGLRGAEGEVAVADTDRVHRRRGHRPIGVMSQGIPWGNGSGGAAEGRRGQRRGPSHQSVSFLLDVVASVL